MKKFRKNDICYFIENTCTVKQAVVISVNGDFYILKYGNNKGIRLRSTRLYATFDEAEAVVETRRQKTSKRHINPYNYEH
jgi:hypothetical protein